MLKETKQRLGPMTIDTPICFVSRAPNKKDASQISRSADWWNNHWVQATINNNHLQQIQNCWRMLKGHSSIVHGTATQLLIGVLGIRCAYNFFGYRKLGTGDFRNQYSLRIADTRIRRPSWQFPKQITCTFPIYEGFHSHGGTPTAGWFMENPTSYWMINGGSLFQETTI